MAFSLSAKNLTIRIVSLNVIVDKKNWQVLLDSYSYYTSGQKYRQILSSGQKNWQISSTQNRYNSQSTLLAERGEANNDKECQWK